MSFQIQSDNGAEEETIYRNNIVSRNESTDETKHHEHENFGECKPMDQKFQKRMERRISTGTWMCEELENLTISSPVVETAVDSAKDVIYHSAGTISNIVLPLNMIVVQPSSDILLYLGTPLFVYCSDLPNSGTVKIGEIEDIFGSINKPMYYTSFSKESMEFLSIGKEVLYLPDHTNTQLMRIERMEHDRFNIIQYKRT